MLSLLRVRRRSALVLVGAVVAYVGHVAHAVSLRAVTVPDAPFVFYDPALVFGGSDMSLAYSGFAVDLLTYIVARANRVYPDFRNDTLNANISLAPNAAYGALLPGGSWNGGIGEVMVGRADVGAAIFTITAARVDDGVQFSVPFLSTGLGVLTLQSMHPATPWRFLLPFSANVWIALILCMLAGTLSTWAIDRLSPFGYYRTASDPEGRRTMNVSNSLYNGILILLGKDAGLARAWSGRIIMVAMFFLAYFMLNAYGAALTALVTVQDVRTEVSSWMEIQARRVAFGVMNQSSIADYFLYSANPTIRGMSTHMRLYPDTTSALTDLRSGVLPAFIGELQQLQYAALTPPCNLVVVGPSMNTQYFAFPFNGTRFATGLLSRVINDGLAAATEDGTTSRLYTNYFAFPGSCTGQGSVQVAGAGLQPTEMAGVVYAYLMLIAVSLLMLGFERFIYSNRNHPWPCFRKLNKGLGLVYVQKHGRRASAEAAALQR